ncbi:hypothetical protein MNBD_GAMMA24-571 [hydrothermal vent metagenome]|uniref:Uncharacterized protein n=1 Tax=hydrothermal vent metagenome TaxID=652676 RepID=A0A3B1BNQ5_9ZZZZ
MSKRIDKEKELREMHDSQASLVNALESIHTLLEKSETKLNAARESLAGSRIDNQKHYNPGASKPHSEPPPESSLAAETDSCESHEEELAVPILEDIVVPGKQQDSLPLFDKADINATTEDIADISEARKQEFIDRLEAIQIEMDDYLNEMLVRCMAGIELELKETLAQKLQQLRDIIEK